ncbi:hyoscyamine 6-dioxygenase-like [Argentina anserina]|uniref:hyoscyamine 6-dioxygenase-like n=1 Tax=Argentina anserina TaxID=57926 RepID=UPI00217622A2|nr:hyoscyamine 6-dioxygenase-like [Potentilla anserina]
MDGVLDQKLVSSWFDVHQSVPETYVFPPEKRPGKLKVPVCKSIPVIDLGSHDRRDTIQQICKASQDFGFFQVINHGVSNKLIHDTMRVFKEFHAMPSKDKARECSKDPSRDCKLYTSSENYANEGVHLWRDALTHPGHTSEKYLQYWPKKPTQYRDVVKRYLEGVRNLGAVIMELLAEGLGLRAEFFNGGLSDSPMLLSNHYPPCPDPSLTLGLTKHRDPSLLTILLQDNEGLQVFKDGNWIGVDPVSTAFVVNVGFVLQIISNTKFRGAEHRVVTNSRCARTTIAYFIYPSNDNLIEPAKALCNRNPPLYRSMTFKEFLKNFKSKVGNTESVLQTISVTSS